MQSSVERWILGGIKADHDLRRSILAQSLIYRSSEDHLSVQALCTIDYDAAATPSYKEIKSVILSDPAIKGNYLGDQILACTKLLCDFPDEWMAPGMDGAIVHHNNIATLLLRNTSTNGAAGHIAMLNWSTVQSAVIHTHLQYAQGMRRKIVAYGVFAAISLSSIIGARVINKLTAKDPK